MRLKSFQDCLQSRLDPEDLRRLEVRASLEIEALKSLQLGVSAALEAYAKREQIGFNELLRRLAISPSQLLKIQRGEANITLASVAHIAALLGCMPSLSFSPPSLIETESPKPHQKGTPCPPL